MGLRRHGREIALQMLYARDYAAGEVGPAMELVLDESEAGAAAGRAFADELVRGVLEHREALDAAIADKSKNWSISRMARVDLNILRLAVFELLYREEIPKNVTINEAIEVAKKFGTEESPSFVNGILDEIASTLPDKG
ncbi:transcription antitermination factor NusB [Geobacter pickeringii]|uniref:Transcription antitermination protein NusB n=1 Tax=Geobacter pickeringii TaxID=345632 RepID=A0A0B5B9A8_9BACT|nr:transcription antitermination factor NusB [Geobacter pickeringii]AJE03308.1 nitrogen utilization protein B [Geobacter pickeringii]